MDYKVVRILDEYRIIINAGSNNGVVKNDIFEIHGVVDTVYDPDTKEILGTLHGIKAKVKAVEVHEKMSVCENVEVFSPFEQNIVSAIVAMQTFTPQPKKLNVDKTQISNPEIYEPIQVGDKAVLKINENSTEIKGTETKDNTEQSEAN